MRVDFEVIQAVLWCITYVLIIFYNIRYRTLGIPPIAIASNFAWETVALLQDVRYAPSSFNIYDVLLGGLGNLIHTAWFFLDVLIVVTYLVFCRPVYLKCKWYWAVLYAADLFLFFFAFEHGGMLLSSFIIDCTMAIEYFLYSFNRKFKVNWLTAAICAVKLLGDWCACLCNRRFSAAVAVLGIVILVLNMGCFGEVLLRLYKENRRDSQ